MTLQRHHMFFADADFAVAAMGVGTDTGKEAGAEGSNVYVRCIRPPILTARVPPAL